MFEPSILVEINGSVISNYVKANLNLVHVPIYDDLRDSIQIVSSYFALLEYNNLFCFGVLK